MFETTTTLSPDIRAAGPAGTSASRRRFPIEHEAEFAEVQAAAPTPSLIMTALVGGLLFHALLIAERQSLSLPASFFAVRGLPVTLGLLALFVLPARQVQYTRALLCVVGWGAMVALVAGLNLAGAGALLAMQGGIAALLLVFGWAAQLPVTWTAMLSLGMLAVDAAALATAPGGSTALKIDSLFAPAFAAGFALQSAWVRREEARRDFLSTRTAAFVGVNMDEVVEENRHLDPVTGVGSRAAFDMRLRAAWEHAAGRRNSVALLMFSIDDFAQKKRDQGYRYGDLLQSKIAGILKEGLRRSDDMVARYDVQHFVVMLPGVGTEGATQIGERLRGCIEELVVYNGAERHRTTVTVGVASLRAKRSVEREKLVECTTRALEQAKQSGGNIVCVEGRGCLPRMV
jgi:diguanylate cyclase (GGDEF)-like protein